MKKSLIKKGIIFVIAGLLFGVGIVSGINNHKSSCEASLKIYTEQNLQHACFTYSPQYPRVGNDVFFDASCSTGDIVDYRWFYFKKGGEGRVDMGTGRTIYYSWGERGEYFVTLEVTFSNTDTDLVTHPVFVENPNPWITISTPNGGENYKEDVLIEWSYNYPFDCLPCFDIYYQKKGGYWALVLSALKGPRSGVSTTSFVWQTDNQHGYYKIRIDMKPCDGTWVLDSDASDSWFLISPNIPPVACYECSDFNPNFDQKVTFDGSCSSDPDGHITKYYWYCTVDDGARVDMGYGKMLNYSWSEPGSYQVTLEVTDDNGSKDQEIKDIRVCGGDTDLDCSGVLEWEKVKPGECVRGSFMVSNVGDTDSSLNWRVESYPNWGNWTFTPKSGRGLKLGDGPVTVQVIVDAPDIKATRFSGEILVVNMDNGSDSDIVNVSLSTQKNKVIAIHPLFRIFLDLLQDIFPKLRPS